MTRLADSNPDRKLKHNPQYDGYMFVFDEQNHEVLRAVKDREWPSLIIERSGLPPGRYDVFCYSDDGSTFKRTYDLKPVNPKLRASPVIP